MIALVSIVAIQLIRKNLKCAVSREHQLVEFAIAMINILVANANAQSEFLPQKIILKKKSILKPFAVLKSNIYSFLIKLIPVQKL